MDQCSIEEEGEGGGEGGGEVNKGVFIRVLT